MAKVLLINANRFKQPWPVVPSGLLCVAASLERERESKIHVLDLCFSRNCAKDIQNSAYNFKPDIIGISIRNIDNGSAYNTLFLLDGVKKEVVEPCKKIFLGPIIIGGPAVGISGREMLEFFDLEYAIRGDGEACMLEFVRRMEEKKPLEGLQGLIIRKNGKIIQDPPPFYVEDLNSLPFSNPHKYIDLRPYRRFDSSLQIQTKRGCGLKCAYCVYNTIEGRQYRFRSPELIAEEIEELVKETGIDHIEFTDSAFNIPPGHAKACLRALIKKGLSLRLRTLGLNPGAVDEELADLMKEAGFTDVDLGAESCSDVTLRSLGKNYTKEDVLRAGKILHKRSISIQWYLLVGAPGETEKTIEETFDTISEAASGWDLINIGVGVRVYNGAPIAEEVKRRNPEHAKDNFLYPAVYEPDDISLERIKVLTKKASFQHANFYMYDEDENIYPFALKLGATILRLFHSKQPLWKFWILGRKIETAFGIRRLKSLLWGQILKRKLPKKYLTDTAGGAKTYNDILKKYFLFMCTPQIRAVCQSVGQKNGQLRILDLGCGPAEVSIGIARNMANCVIYGLDNSSAMLNLAGENVKKAGLENKIILRKINSDRIDFEDNYFDVVLFAGVIRYINDPIPLLKEIRRVTKDFVILRDPIRPFYKFLLPIYLCIYGMLYTKLMKMEYREALETSFTVAETKDILNRAGITKTRMYKTFPHFLTVVYKKNSCG